MKCNPEQMARNAAEMLETIDEYDGEYRADRIQLILAEALTAIALAQNYLPRFRTNIDMTNFAATNLTDGPIWVLPKDEVD